MARGGGTGSRSKQKKKSDPVLSNGATNGIASDTDQKFAQTKVTKQRKKDDGQPPAVLHTEEDATQKEEKINSKLQPTSEQLRLAQITQDSHLDPQRKGKINQVIDFTGKSEDEVATALFDCSWDVQRAIELLLEEGGDLGSWEESGKKKKKKQDKDKEDKGDDWGDDNFEPSTTRQDSDMRDRSRGGRGGAPRFKRGGGQGMGVGRQDMRDGQDTDRMEGGRGRGGGRGMSRGSRGGLPYRQRGRGGSQRSMGAVGSAVGGAGSAGIAADSGPFGQMDTWNPTGEEFNGKAKSSSKDAFDNAGNWGDDFPAAEDWDNDEYTGSLSDTKVFTPSGATVKSAVGEPINSVGSGGVPQPAVSAASVSSSLGGGGSTAPYSQQIDLAALLQKPGITPVVGSSAAPGGPTSMNQFNQTATQDLKSAIGIGGPSPASSSNKTEQLTSGFSSSIDYSSGAGGAGGGGGGSGGPTSATGGGGVAASSVASSQFSHNPQSQNNFGTSTPGSAFSPIKPASVTNVNPSSKSMPRARLPPPSKIPSSAVEMPGDSLANLDVQFGGLDLQFGTSSSDSSSSAMASSSAAAAAAGFDFRSTSLSAATKDLDSKYIAITSTESYKPVVSAGVLPPPPANIVSAKDVNQSLTSAMSGSAGMKSSSSTDNSFGAASAAAAMANVGVAAGVNQQRGGGPVVVGAADTTGNKPNSNFSSQRSPGPVQTMDRTKPPAVTDSLGGFSASTTVGSGYSGYPVSNQTKQSSSQFGSHSSSGAAGGYPTAANGYERQSSSGYSSASYGSGSVSSSFGNSNSSGGSSNNTSGVAAAATSNGSFNSSTGKGSSSSGVNNTGSSSSSSNNAFNSGYSSNTNSYSSYSTKSTPSTTGKLETSSTGGSSYSSNNFGISSTVSNKMNANSSVSSKMLHNLPPGVASMIPQYMMAGASAATFPAYLAAGLQQPMYGYGAGAAAVGAAGAAGAVGAAGAAGAAPQLGGVSSQQLEDLAAMQRNTLANLPLVGTAAAGSQPAASSKGPHTGGYYDPSSGFGSGQASTVASTRADASTLSDSTKFGGGTAGIGVTDSTSSPVPSTVATGQPTPFNALASTFAAAPTQHLPPGYAYFYGAGLTPQMQAAAYGGTSVYPPHPGIVPTATGPTATTQFQNKGYGSSYNSYDNLNLGQNNSDYGKSNFPSQGAGQTKGTNSNTGHWFNGMW